MMDELWRSDNLDLKMLSYTCLATGKQVGLIQVVCMQSDSLIIVYFICCNCFHYTQLNLKCRYEL